MIKPTYYNRYPTILGVVSGRILNKVGAVFSYNELLWIWHINEKCIMSVSKYVELKTAIEGRGMGLAASSVAQYVYK